MRKILEYLFFGGLATMVLLVFYGVVCCLLVQAGVHITHHVPHWWLYSAFTAFAAVIFSGIGAVLMDFIDWYMKAINE